jgi:predicted metal-dependent peptidase
VGKLSEGLEQFVDKLRENKVDWKSELRRFINQTAKNDYSWQRPNRKMLAAGFYLPGLHSETCGTILIGADESGSVDLAITAAFAAEIDAIKEDLRPEKLVLAHFDSRVGKVEEFLPDDPFEMTRYCHGGTDFRPVIKYGRKMATPPICAIILTDLYGPFPEHPPGYPVLWVSINKQQAPWGETINIEV